jgi:hypothetical protein
MYTQLCGWVDRPADVAAIAAMQPFPFFTAGATASNIVGIGRGKRTLLYQALYQAVGGKANWHCREQLIGDCVSMGAALAVDVLRALQFVMHQSEYIAETATEPIYSMSRIDIGQGRLGNEDGSVGAWAAQAVKQLGTLVRAKYGDIDLTKYDGNRAKAWGAPHAGCPDSLKPLAKQHLVKTTSLVTTWAALCDSITAGYPVTVASNQGFSNVRDAQGFLRPDGTWGHQMAVIATDDASRRPGALLQNSWPVSWVSGPATFDQPPGSFWVDAEVIENKMLSAQDAWAYSDLDGYPAKKFDLGDIF